MTIVDKNIRKQVLVLVLVLISVDSPFYKYYYLSK